MAELIGSTNFSLPGQVGEVEHGKVADTYTIEHPKGPLLVAIRTDRISVFDAVLPDLIPGKGQILNQMSAFTLAAAADIVPTWILDVPDPNVTIGIKAEPVKVEMIMRRVLTGSAWKGYSQKDMRNLSGNILPDGLHEFHRFEPALVTPTSKADRGQHDENITPHEIYRAGLATRGEYYRMSLLARKLFGLGEEMATAADVVFADTKYEFGRKEDGELVTIDEAHTPDSSRFYDREPYEAYVSGETDERPEELSKEYARNTMEAKGFTGKEDQIPPHFTEHEKEEIRRRYMRIYEAMTGKPFELQDYSTDPLGRMEENIVASLERLAA